MPHRHCSAAGVRSPCGNADVPARPFPKTPFVNGQVSPPTTILRTIRSPTSPQPTPLIFSTPKPPPPPQPQTRSDPPTPPLPHSPSAQPTPPYQSQRSFTAKSSSDVECAWPNKSQSCVNASPIPTGVRPTRYPSYKTPFPSSKPPKKTIHSLQLKLQAAESECARLVALLAKLQPNLLTHQSHPSNPSSLPHHQPHLQHLPPPPSASHCSTAAPSAQLLPSSGPRDPPLNFDTVVPHASFRDAVAVAAVPASIAPNSDLPSAPVVHHSVPWNPFPPAQQFSYAAASTAIAHPPAPLSHLPHPLSQPAHTSLPHLSSVPHSHQPVAPAHSVALYTSHKRSLSRETRPKPQQHQSLQHQPLHQQRHVHPSQQQISPQRPHSTSAQPPHLPHSAAVRPPADHPTVSNRKDPTHHS
ncbi:hypothetical protein BWQ96_02870 [Gracilariopsis chorda]|uniref:Uncharacterized protein n=1 Tax=Gracilariopsis chorda TaxID=448386 RepID=A0A2V3J1W2_9FLOR|nr:hypothetical protein BWQ96_02870 [Gracilariopsis chorda]|eukprot:PXF47390.1 hypothetical protein BWQ96_02870 [Gracilariopsis chorda]